MTTTLITLFATWIWLCGWAASWTVVNIEGQRQGHPPSLGQGALLLVSWPIYSSIALGYAIGAPIMAALGRPQ